MQVFSGIAIGTRNLTHSHKGFLLAYLQFANEHHATQAEIDLKCAFPHSRLFFSQLSPFVNL